MIPHFDTNVEDTSLFTHTLTALIADVVCVLLDVTIHGQHFFLMKRLRWQESDSGVINHSERFTAKRQELRVVHSAKKTAESGQQTPY